MLLGCLIAVAAGCGRETKVSVPPPEVSVSQPVEEPVQETLEFTGRLSAVDSVEVRSRVTGFITKVAFAAGALVNKGAASARELERAIADKGAAEGELKAKLAQLDLARLDLEFTRVTAPVTGRASRAEFTVGNLVVVGATGGPLLTTVVSLDPIYVNFDADERALIRVRKANIARDGAATPENIGAAQAPVLVALAEENDFSHRGTIDFIDNQIDPSTGTIHIRAVLPNPDRLLVPQMFVRVRVPLGESRSWS